MVCPENTSFQTHRFFCGCVFRRCVSPAFLCKAAQPVPERILQPVQILQSAGRLPKKPKRKNFYFPRLHLPNGKILFRPYLTAAAKIKKKSCAIRLCAYILPTPSSKLTVYRKTAWKTALRTRPTFGARQPETAFLRR